MAVLHQDKSSYSIRSLWTGMKINLDARGVGFSTNTQLTETQVG